MNICVDCAFFKGSRKDIWYEQFCAHKDVRFVPTQNPVTGGMEYPYGGQQYPHARDINKGDCNLYVEHVGKIT